MRVLAVRDCPARSLTEFFRLFVVLLAAGLFSLVAYLLGCHHHHQQTNQHSFSTTNSANLRAISQQKKQVDACMHSCVLQAPTSPSPSPSPAPPFPATFIHSIIHNLGIRLFAPSLLHPLTLRLLSSSLITFRRINLGIVRQPHFCPCFAASCFPSIHIHCSAFAFVLMLFAAASARIHGYRKEKFLFGSKKFFCEIPFSFACLTGSRRRICCCCCCCHHHWPNNAVVDMAAVGLTCQSGLHTSFLQIVPLPLPFLLSSRLYSLSTSNQLKVAHYFAD